MQQPLAFAAIGALVAQLAVVSVWCALGPSAFKWRLLITSSLAITLSSAFIVGLQIPELPNSSMPFWVGAIILASGISGFAISAAALKCLALLTKERIVHRTARVTRCDDWQSFSIGYLVGLTTAVAAVIATIRAVIPMEAQRAPPEIFSVVLVIGQHTLFSVLLLGCCVTLVLRVSGNWQGALGLVLLLIVATPANLILLGQYRAFRINGEMILYFLCYVVGLVVTSLSFLVLVRIVGYRMCRV